MTRTPAPALSAEEAAIVARFGIFDDENRVAAKALRDAASALRKPRSGWRRAVDLLGKVDMERDIYARWLDNRAAALDPS